MVTNDKPTRPYPPLPLVSCGTMKYKVLELLSKGGNPHSISREVGRKRSTIIEHLQGLEKLGLAIKGEYLWSITREGKDYLGGRLNLVGYERNGVDVTNWLQDRCHNIKIKYEVIEKPSNRMWLTSWSKNSKIKNNVFYTKRFGEIVTTFTGKSLIFQLPILKYKNSEIAVAEAGRISIALKDKYEYEIVGLKLGQREVTAQLITQHHAIPQEPYAKFCSKHGISYKDDYIDIDASDTPELEFTDKDNAHLHHNRYIKQVTDIILNNPPTNSELNNRHEQLLKAVEGLVQVESINAENIVTHFRVLTGIEQTLSGINKSIKRLNKTIKSNQVTSKNIKQDNSINRNLFDF